MTKSRKADCSQSDWKAKGGGAGAISSFRVTSAGNNKVIVVVRVVAGEERLGLRNSDDKVAYAASRLSSGEKVCALVDDRLGCLM
ncbi:hypothetical protein CBOM_08124 [Ceraceosorus bombacis]|uniref:Uncharacterized protein n=1 Tax=Ceraceosorus bombacis TaxID=401625 RepID=A0A0N7L8R7_9BASI|nr:hypothetical protein CBOM_08124 [Ceraceosorus bombacis]